ncbi:uncharacterized protein LOC128551358 [Mercenaria mercenaria]|uniref:uncharacterized protein LOC128551358 n=1 Tax=Mercenaria mercenaria TaxID=6596 RepID=UPI00234E4A2B|nr:uncharacterized protein LOC128551358 [Mercenaria mercenaria]
MVCITRNILVKDRFYGQHVKLEGYIAVLRIMSEVETDFTNYTLVLGNVIGSTNMTLKHISESRPSVPKFFNYTGLVNSVPTFLLVGGFNGGRLQTFVIETAIAGTDKWVEQLRFSEKDRTFLQKDILTFIFNITGLWPNSYDVRVRVGNDIDWIPDHVAPKIHFTITSDDEEMHSSPVAIIVGITLGVLIFITVIVVVVVLTRKLKLSGGKKRQEINEM